jgi:hypothetical protein
VPRVATATAQPVLVLAWQPRTTGRPPCHHQHDNGDQCGYDYGDDDSHAIPPVADDRTQPSTLSRAPRTHPPAVSSGRGEHSAPRLRTGPAGPVRGDSRFTCAGHRPRGHAPRSRPVDLVQRSARPLHVTWQTTAPGPGPGDGGQRPRAGPPGTRRRLQGASGRAPVGPSSMRWTRRWRSLTAAAVPVDRAVVDHDPFRLVVRQLML